MSHSSNLMTIDSMIQYLETLRCSISSHELTVSQYLSFFDLFEKVRELEVSISDLRLIVEVEDSAQQGSVKGDVYVSENTAARSTTFEGAMPLSKSPSLTRVCGEDEYHPSWTFRGRA